MSGGVLSARTAIVVGAGLGGLASAIALQQRGWEVSVVEQSAELAPVGAGIALGPTALRALDVVGVGQAVRSMAAWQGVGGYRTPDGSCPLRMDLQGVWERLGDAIVILRRAELIDLLVDRLSADRLRLGDR